VEDNHNYFVGASAVLCHNLKSGGPCPPSDWSHQFGFGFGTPSFNLGLLGSDPGTKKTGQCAAASSGNAF
jgi:hypothetical protein